MITLFLNTLSKRITGLHSYERLLARMNTADYPITVEGPEGLYSALIVANIHTLKKRPSLIVLPTEAEAETIASDLSMFTDQVALFPWWGTTPYSDVSPQASLSGRRLKILSDIREQRPVLVIASLRAFLSLVPDPAFMEANTVVIRKSEAIDPLAVSSRLADLGYSRVPRVSVHGDFALRGEVLDVFPPGYDEPVRILFEFDEVEDLRTFQPITQSSTGHLDDVRLLPVKETLWTEERVSALSEALKSEKNVPDETYEALLDAAEKGECTGESFLYPLSFSRTYTISDYVPDRSVLYLMHNEHLESGWDVLQKEYRRLYPKAKTESDVHVPHPSKLLPSYPDIVADHERTVFFPAIKSSTANTGTIEFAYEGPRSFFGNIDYFQEELDRLFHSGYAVTIFADSEAQRQRIEHLLHEHEVSVVPASISHGFSLPDLKIAVIQEDEIFGRRKRRPRSVKTAKSSVIDTFVELNPGDFVVHINYGIGRFKGIERITAAGTERDYIQVEYADAETVFIPIEQVNLIQRYIGQEGHAPRLDKIGGKSWESRKNRVKKSVEDLADHLLKLYSRRKTSTGFAFPADTDWQYEFEASFPFEETEDQLRCIDEVKADMEKPEPMDRLVCGDVGYGKTEIAMRAAFKAVTAGRQVAFLAPTTILAEQHYENFVERFDPYPVEIRMISRFVNRAEQRKTTQAVKAGEVDILLGTHRLLQKDVRFQKLGLLVIDEEQRFGVKDKERLKELKANVDCLTLSATPIPRTLHMSLLKLRDMSVLTTAPHNRRPIETVIREFDEELVVDAIRREMERGGQVYYLHNRVETLNNVRRFLERLIPEAMVETAHGKLRSEELEDIMHRFIHGSYQVLVATTIIENGIDIPNVNTIIIDRADMYGISQLYQLRGRVGRSDRLAYAYLLYPGERALSEIAMKRLQVISDHTELGSGFKVALKDLEVRGAGNLLGRQQHGDILSVGFDMYIRLLDQAIAELSDEERDDTPEAYLELDYSGFIPNEYIAEPEQKMEVYKKIASISSEGELEAVFAELLDRFGPLPDEVQSLLSLAEIRILCRKLRISRLKERGGNVEVEFGRIADISIDKVMRLIKESGGSVVPDPKRPNVLKLATKKIGLAEKSEFLRERLEALL